MKKKVLIFTLPIVVGVILLIGLQEVTKYFLKREAILRSSPVAESVAKRSSVLSGSAQIFLYGDSRVAEWKLPSDLGVAKVGVGGATSSELRWSLPLLEGDFKGRRILIQCGINDLKSLAYSDSSVEAVTDECVRNISGIADYFVGKGASPVVILGVFPTSEVPLWRRPFWDEDISKARLVVNRRLSRMQSECEWQFLSCDKFLEPETMYRDELHLKGSSYELLNQFLGLEESI